MADKLNSNQGSSHNDYKRDFRMRSQHPNSMQNTQYVNHQMSSQKPEYSNVPSNNQSNQKYASTNRNEHGQPNSGGPVSSQRNDRSQDFKGNHQHNPNSHPSQKYDIPPDNRDNFHGPSSHPAQRNNQLQPSERRNNYQQNSTNHTTPRKDLSVDNRGDYQQPINRNDQSQNMIGNYQPLVSRNGQSQNVRGNYPPQNAKTYNGQTKDPPSFDNRNNPKHSLASQSVQMNHQSEDNRGNHQQTTRPITGHSSDNRGNIQNADNKYNQSHQSSKQSDYKKTHKNDPGKGYRNNDEIKTKGYHGSMGNIPANSANNYHPEATSKDSSHLSYNTDPNVQQPNKDHRRHEQTSFSNQTKDRRDHTYHNHGYQNDKPHQAHANMERNEHLGDKSYKQSVHNSRSDQPMRPNIYQDQRKEDSERRYGHENRGYYHDDEGQRNNKLQDNYNKQNVQSNHGSNIDKTTKYEHNVPDYHGSNHHINNKPTGQKNNSEYPPKRPQDKQVPSYHGSRSQINNYANEETRSRNEPLIGQKPSYHGSNYQINKASVSGNNQPVSYHKSAPAPVAPQRNKHLSSSKPDLSYETQNKSSAQQQSQYHSSYKADLSKSCENLNRGTSQHMNSDTKHDEKSTYKKSEHNTALQTNQSQANSHNEARNRIHSDDSQDKRKYERRTANVSNVAPSAKRRERIQSHQETGISGPIPKSYRNSNMAKQSGFDPTPPTRTTSMGALNQIGQPSFISNNPLGSNIQQSNLYRSNSVPTIAVSSESGNLNSTLPHSNQNGGLNRSQSILSLAMIQAQQTNLQRSASLASLVASNPNLARTASVYAMYELQVEQGIIPKDHRQTLVLSVISIFVLPPISFLLGGLCFYYTVQNEHMWKTNLQHAMQTNTRIFWCSIGLIVLSICIWFTVILVVLLHHA